MLRNEDGNELSTRARPSVTSLLALPEDRCTAAVGVANPLADALRVSVLRMVALDAKIVRFAHPNCEGIGSPARFAASTPSYTSTPSFTAVAERIDVDG